MHLYINFINIRKRYYTYETFHNKLWKYYVQRHTTNETKDTKNTIIEPSRHLIVVHMRPLMCTRHISISRILTWIHIYIESVICKLLHVPHIQKSIGIGKHIYNWKPWGFLIKLHFAYNAIIYVVVIILTTETFK